MLQGIPAPRRLALVDDENFFSVKLLIFFVSFSDLIFHCQIFLHFIFSFSLKFGWAYKNGGNEKKYFFGCRKWINQLTTHATSASILVDVIELENRYHSSENERQEKWDEKIKKFPFSSSFEVFPFLYNAREAKNIWDSVGIYIL